MEWLSVYGPWLLIGAACIGMHLLMYRGHGENSGGNPSSTGRWDSWRYLVRYRESTGPDIRREVLAVFPNGAGLPSSWEY